ncbi:hypothetical protein NCS56_00762200 [Fusarium sp. Ph1]|nr:hypothetical protein NCS56_00762200 [Fusarium sp. Ph1]
MPPVCPTWVFAPTGTAHVACDRHWLSDDYTPFKTWLTDSRGVKFEAIGVGNIILPVDLSNGNRGEIFLRNVLHFPDAACNSIGGRSLSITISMVRMSAFEVSKAEAGAFLSDSERAWLKEHWGNEFKFLAAYGLSIYDDEERKEGREIMRMTIAKEKEPRELDKHAHDDSHLIDHYFSDDELEEIELQFGNSKKFLEEYLGFSIHNDEHCRAARRNIQEFMRQDGLK